MKDSVINHGRVISNVTKLYHMYLLNNKWNYSIESFRIKIEQGYTFSEIVNMKKYTNPKKRAVIGNAISKEKERYWIRYFRELK